MLEGGRESGGGFCCEVCIDVCHAIDDTYGQYCGRVQTMIYHRIMKPCQ